MAARVVIAAGGTGGHIYPGLALADALRTLAPQTEVSFVGTTRGLEGDIIPRAGYELDVVDMVPFTGANRVVLPVALLRAGAQSRRVLRRRAAHVAVGMGGYASAPLLLGARLSRLPSLIHESGAIPGKANLLAARLTDNIATSFHSAVAAFPPGKIVRVTGMPLAAEFSTFNRDRLRPDARRALGLPDDACVLFVMGGSQGATRLTTAAVELGGRWRDRDDIHILLKLGARAGSEIDDRVAALGADKVVHRVAYLDRMDTAYAAADVALCRAGAGTVAELAVTGLPAVLVPYPFATGDHQRENAGELVAAGAAVVVADGDATAETIGPLVEALVADRAELARRSAAARSVGRPDAAQQLARWVLELAGSQ
ncbi:MAG: UDP-N-acetylglucosamine--N-acetylmuramyl-(pentapeptide) pyrophosphoryl-undecaprenol [Frankiaceae bacterium]|jgi:UDP-N-acetylglucosamine--N-acetylmuramyl-(pentapeptide) pyrophosphoryl-undecaprenol N-acetylglucosamine transferase|nr:UDP-N-acetylglucosamine--N-acetylmuramyl-(pentapeptide) pyrophosphoryl-undecaprenol [Frankiaceae bacterium]